MDREIGASACKKSIYWTSFSIVLFRPWLSQSFSNLLVITAQKSFSLKMRLITALFLFALVAASNAAPMDWTFVGEEAAKEGSETLNRELADLHIGDTYRPPAYRPRPPPGFAPPPTPPLPVAPHAPEAHDALRIKPTDAMAATGASGSGVGRSASYISGRIQKSSSETEQRLRGAVAEAMQGDKTVRGGHRRSNSIARYPSMNDLQWNDEFVKVGIDRGDGGWRDKLRAEDLTQQRSS